MAVVIAGYKFIDHWRCNVKESAALARCADDRLDIVLAQDPVERRALQMKLWCPSSVLHRHADPIPLCRLLRFVGLDLSSPEKGDRGSGPSCVLEMKQLAVSEAASHWNSPDECPTIDVTNEVENGFGLQPVDH